MTSALIRRGRDPWDTHTHTERKGQVMTEAVAAICKPMRGVKRNQPCQYLSLRLPASRTLRKQTSVVWATQSVVFCYDSPSKLTQGVTWPDFHVFCLQSFLPHLRLQLRMSHCNSTKIFISYLQGSWVFWNGQNMNWFFVVFFQSAILNFA